MLSVFQPGDRPGMDLVRPVRDAQGANSGEDRGGSGVAVEAAGAERLDGVIDQA